MVFLTNRIFGGLQMDGVRFLGVTPLEFEEFVSTYKIELVDLLFPLAVVKCLYVGLDWPQHCLKK